ncbi:MAG: hypothetical protein MR008_00350 [Aerococcus sp.]|nr:hypothetical protein [Aerococcus sp.]
MQSLKPNQLLLGLCAGVVLIGALFNWTLLYWVAALLFGWSIFEEVRERRQQNKKMMQNADTSKEALKERFKLDKRR